MNVSGALETLGKGLFEVGKVKLNREDDEMAFMRQKALQDLGIQAQKDMQASNQEFQGKLAKEGQEHDRTMFGMNTAARMGEQVQGQEFQRGMERDRQGHAERLQADMKSFQLKIREDDSIENVIRSTNSMLGDIGKSIDFWDGEMLRVRSEGGDPEVLKEYESRIASLYAQQQTIREQGMAQVSRMTGGKPIKVAEGIAPAQGAPAPNAAPTPVPAANAQGKPRYEGKGKGDDLFASPADDSIVDWGKVGRVGSGLKDAAIGYHAATPPPAQPGAQSSFAGYQAKRPDVTDPAQRKALGLPPL